MMDAWTSLVRNGKVGQDIAIAHPSPDDGISHCRDCSNRTSLGKRRIADCIAVGRTPIPCCNRHLLGAIRDGSGAATDRAHRSQPQAR